jgi:hypothetical protein
MPLFLPGGRLPGAGPHSRTRGRPVTIAPSSTETAHESEGDSQDHDDAQASEAEDGLGELENGAEDEQQDEETDTSAG